MQTRKFTAAFTAKKSLMESGVEDKIRLVNRGQAVAKNGFPFEIKRHNSVKTPYAYMTEDELMAKLERSRKHADEGIYKEADNMVAEMRAKYGL